LKLRRRLARAIERGLKPGDSLRLRADVVHGPTVFSAGMKGSELEPILVEPYRGPKVVFDARIRSPNFGQAGNGAWQRVPGGHPDEWRTRAILDEADGRVMYGQLLDSKYRLITYARIEDLRADNESFTGRGVPLADPRPAGGPLQDEPARKIPWTYLGPGIHWMPEAPGNPLSVRGRMHIRLSRTRRLRTCSVTAPTARWGP
jgi:hypothetical protein